MVETNIDKLIAELNDFKYQLRTQNCPSDEAIDELDTNVAKMRATVRKMTDDSLD